MIKTIDRYLVHLRDERCNAPKTVYEYISAIRKLSTEINPLEAKNHREVKDALLRLKEKFSWGGSTTKKNSKDVRYFYAWCTREEILPFNPYPFDDFKKPRAAEAPYITENEYKLILREQILDNQDRAMIMTAWDTAVRREELSRLDQKDFDFNDNVLHLPREKTKGNYSDRWIPFTPVTRAALLRQKEWLNRHNVFDPIFVNFEFNRISPNRINERFKRITVIKENGDRMTLTPKMLRHSFGIRMLKKYKVPQIVVMKWMGHADPGVTNHYCHMTRQDSKDFFFQYVQKSIPA